jgi:hypothetical protein
MARARALDRLALVLLIVGAIVFVLLLAGVGSGVLTDPTPYVPVSP